MEKDTYVLCRVFHKNNIGPPNGNRYAPFNEKEWDDGNATFPGEYAGDDGVVGADPKAERKGNENAYVEWVSVYSPSLYLPLFPLLLSFWLMQIVDCQSWQYLQNI